MNTFLSQSFCQGLAPAEVLLEKNHALLWSISAVLHLLSPSPCPPPCRRTEVGLCNLGVFAEYGDIPWGVVTGPGTHKVLPLLTLPPVVFPIAFPWLLFPEQFIFCLFICSLLALSLQMCRVCAEYNLFNRKRVPEAEATDFSRALGRPNSATVATGLQKPLLFIYLFYSSFSFPGCINLQRILSHVVKLVWPEELILPKTSLSLSHVWLFRKAWSKSRRVFFRNSRPSAEKGTLFTQIRGPQSCWGLQIHCLWSFPYVS